jgi:alkyl hydroperoxide reductase subunit AhpF
MFYHVSKRACAALVGAGIGAFGFQQVTFAQENVSKEQRHKVLIVGGGTAGTTVANQIHRKVRIASLKRSLFCHRN